MTVIAPTGVSMKTIRAMFVEQWRRTPNSQVGGTVEIVGSSFEADEPTIFGAVNAVYVKNELAWYESMSRDVNDIPGGPPKIWREVADRDGLINSNYGFLMFSKENHSQYEHVRDNLAHRPNGRQAIAIYTRPSMHYNWSTNGRKDFVCTNAVCYFLRDGAVHAVVQMRSNDAVFGYRNDYAWQRHVLQRLAEDVDASVGKIAWQAASLHIYRRHYGLIQHYAETGEYRRPIQEVKADGLPPTP